MCFAYLSGELLGAFGNMTDPGGIRTSDPVTCMALHAACQDTKADVPEDFMNNQH